MKDDELASLERAHAADPHDEHLARRLAAARERTGDLAGAIRLLLRRDTPEVVRLLLVEPLAFAAAARHDRDATLRFLCESDEGAARIAMAALVKEGHHEPLIALASLEDQDVMGREGWWAQQALRTVLDVPCSPWTLRASVEGELFLAASATGAEGPAVTIEAIEGHPFADALLTELREVVVPEGGWVAYAADLCLRAELPHAPWLEQLAKVPWLHPAAAGALARVRAV